MKNTAVKKIYSLKSRVTRAFLFNTIVSFVFVNVISYFTIYSILYEKIEKGVYSSTAQIVTDMDIMLDNLARVSHQLSFEGIVANDLSNFISSQSYAEKRKYYDSINKFLSLVDFTNPNAGLRFYYTENSPQTLFSNYTSVKQFKTEDMPFLANSPSCTFYGPHLSKGAQKNSYVVSLSRPVDLLDSGEDKYHIYLETNPSVLANILNKKQVGMKIYYAIANSNGIITYSQMPDLFKQGHEYEQIIASGKAKTKISDYYAYLNTSTYGWHLISIINKSEYNKEIRIWAFRVAYIGIFLMAVTILTGMLLWRTIYSSLKLFRKEISLMADVNFDSPVEYTGIIEFDKALSQFHVMKGKIKNLIKEIEQKEKDKLHLEVDKLLYQINPHFLYNTLNTVQWIARAEGNKKIVKIVSNLIRLLRYNLGKEGETVTISKEIEALKCYISLQQERNDYNFEVVFDIDDEALDYNIPRFILQPLVENSIYHGLEEGEGTIWIYIKKKKDDKIVIVIKDNGPGIPEDMLKKLLEPKNRNENALGLGIGLNYVNKMLKVYYGDESNLEIESKKGQGTLYRFVIPAAFK